MIAREQIGRAEPERSIFAYRRLHRRPPLVSIKMDELATKFKGRARQRS